MIRERTVGTVTAATTILTARLSVAPYREPKIVVDRRLAQRGRTRPGHGRRASDRIRESAARRAWAW